MNYSRRDHIMIVSVETLTEEFMNPIDKSSCVIPLVTELSPMSRATELGKILCGGIQLVRTHDKLVLNGIALVAQGIVDTVPKVP